MIDQTKLETVKPLISEANSIAILLPPEPNADIVGAALGLHLAFQQAGKFSQIGCSGEIKVENADLFGIDQIRDTIGNQNLLVSFDFKEENLKKVDYDVDENGKFTLLIQPQPGTPPPDAASVNFSYSGASADLVFILGINSLEELGKLYADEKAFLDNATKIGLSVSGRPSSVATHDLSSPDSSCVAEIAALFVKETGLEPGPDGASNLLSTIYNESKQYTSNRVSADTFDVIAFLMRAGGSLPHSSPFQTSSRFGAFPPAGGSPFGGSPFGGSPFGSPSLPPMFDEEPLPQAPANNHKVPGDWKKPKIFRSGNGPKPAAPSGQGMNPAGSL